MAVRAPHLHLTLRAFCLGAFVFLGRALEEGDDLPFAFEEHVQRHGPALYEYRPLVRSFVESRASALARRDDAPLALDELLREPAAAIFARAHAGPKPTEEQALFRTVLLSLLISTAEACGGFDWDDRAFERAYAELERSLFGGSARLRGGRAARRALGRDAGRARRRDPRCAPRRPASSRITGPRRRGCSRPTSAARSTATACSSSSARLEPGEEPPDAPGRARRRRLRDPARDRGAGRRRAGALRAARLAAVRDPAGAADRRDAAARRADAARLVPRRACARRCSRGSRSPTRDAALAEALDRWELSLFQNEPFRSEQLRGALAGLLGETWELRAAVLLGDASEERRAIHAALRSLADGRAGVASAPRLRCARSLVETLRHGDRARSSRSLDDELLGLRAARRVRSRGRDRTLLVTERVALPSRGAALASTAWTKPASSPGSTGSTRSTGRRGARRAARGAARPARRGRAAGARPARTSKSGRGGGGRALRTALARDIIGTCRALGRGREWPSERPSAGSDDLGSAAGTRTSASPERPRPDRTARGLDYDDGEPR